MKLEFDEGLNYECVRCGRSCRDWNVWVDPATERALTGHPLTLRVIEERGAAWDHVPEGTRMRRDEHRDPACGFLDDRGLCSIHRDLGLQAKPVGCQQFPLLLTRLPGDVVRVSASFACSGVQRSAGPPLAAQAAEVERLLQAGATVSRVDGVVDLGQGVEAPWALVEQFEAVLEQQAGGSSAGWAAALASHAVRLAEVLSQLEAGHVLSEPWWQTEPSPERLQRWDTLRQALLPGLLKPCLSAQNRDLWRRIDVGFLGLGDLDLPEWGWTGDLTSWEAWLAVDVRPVAQPEANRIRNSFRFRKTHLTSGGLLAGLLLLWSLEPLYSCLVGLHAWRAGRSAQPPDLWAAQDTLETGIGVHSGNGSLALQPFAAFLSAVES